MKLPTSNGNDLYQVGNDYPQVAKDYFDTKSYADGIYTAALPVGYTTASQDGFDDKFFAQKEPVGLNKRILDVLPQSAWAAPTEDDVNGDLDAISAVSAVFSPDYAAGELSAFPEA